jgi:hypothetical protein
MPVNFPNSPSNADEHSANGLVYKYNSAKGAWKRKFVAPTDATDINQLNDSSGLLTSSSTTVVADMAALIALTGMSSGDQAFVTANNKLYFYNGSGWYLIATVQNDAPSAITGVNGTYELSIDGTATTITAVSTDPEGFPLTWSSSTSGLGSIATVSNTDNVFTITPSTTVSDAGTFTLTINATDGVNGAVSTSTNLTLTFIVIVTNSRYTTLLATADGTSDNNNITDSSSNNHSITVNGDTHAGTFSPYRSGGYSTKFDPNSYFNILNQPAIGSGDCSIECWVNVANFSRWHGIIKRGANSSAGCFQFYVRNDTELYLDWSSTEQTTSGANIQINTWHWLQVIRSSGTVTIYVDGVSRASFSDSSNISSTTYYDIGGWTGNYSDALIRDLRVSTVARSSSTGPSDKLEVDSDTTFLTCNSPYVTFSTPSAVNNYVQYISGPVLIEPFSPYDNLEYSATDHGGSVYFDGIGDGLVTSTIIPATGNFTLEGWVYSTSTDSSQIICGQRTNSGSGRSGIAVNAGNINFYQIGSSVIDYTTSNLEALNKWCHFVLMRTSNNLAFYVNGERKLNTTSGTFEQTNFEVGTDVELDSLGLNYGLYGFVSDLQVSLSAKYSEGTSVTVPTAPLSSSGTALHIKGTDASIIDKSQGSNIKLIGNTTGTSVLTGSSTPPYIGSGWAGKSVINLGSTSENYRVEALSKDDNGIGFPDLFNGECTVEFWMRSLTLARQDIWAFGNTSRNNIYLRQEHDNRIRLTVINSFGSAEFNQESTATISQNTWHHVCFMCNGSSVAAVYLDGTKILPASGTHVNLTSFVPDTSDSNVKFVLGNNPFNGNLVWGGYISDFRVTTNNVYGNPQTTASFTPPTASLEG